MILRIIRESILQAFAALRGNKLRSFLSLMGIMIGIFCIISVKSAVNSLESSIKNGFSELGSDVVYIDKMPWNEDPEMNYWKYAKRPDPSYDEFINISEKVPGAEKASYAVFTGGRTVSYNSSYVDGAFIMGSTFTFNDIQQLNFEKGRYLTRIEYEMGHNKIVLGNKVANELFETIDPIGKYVKLFGQKFLVIGVLEAEGDNMFNFMDFDEVLWISYHNMRKYINVKETSRVGRILAVQAKEDIDLEELKDQITGVVRSSRRLRPNEESNFALNEISMLDQVLESVFTVLNVVGLVIGIFALIVGMFSVANIMFVSVLIEAIILCLIGGFFGLILVYFVLLGISSALPLDMALTTSNMLTGVLASVIVGIISGIIPALQASNMDPVEAIRA